MTPPTEPRGPLAPKLPPIDPPAALEDRVTASLTQRGLLVPPARERLGRTWQTALAIAAGVALFVAGGIAQRALGARAAPPSDDTPRYALLLYGGRTENDTAERARVDEYRRWLSTVAAGGRYVAGEKLNDRALELTARDARERDATDDQSLAGFFIIGAATPAEAESIARSCPHLRHGGRVVVRPIDPT